MEGEFLFITQQSLAEYFLPKTLLRYKKKYPTVIPKLTLGNTSIAKERLESKNVDFSIHLDNVELKNCNTTELCTGKFVLYKGRNFKKRDYQFLVTGETPEFFDFKEKYKKRFKTQPEILMEIKSWGILKNGK